MDARSLDLPARIDTGHAVGMMLVTVSAVFFALAGIFTRSVTAGPWTIACWRGLVGAAIIAAYVLWRARGPHMWSSLHLGLRGWALAVVSTLSSIAFITAFKLTYVANVTIIYATVPFMAAGLERVVLGERTRRSTIVAAVLSLAGVGIMMLGGIGTGSLAGNFMAILMTAGCALYMVLIRKFTDAPVVWTGAVAAFLLFVIGCLITDPLDVTRRDAVLMCAFGVSFAAAVILWTEGTRLVSAAESGLLGSTEVPLAILFAWLFLGELPPAASLVGGGIVIVVIFGYAAWNFRRSVASAAA
ncbi:DMT family transporter [Mesorhizobium koreense]|jgi:drug/metabolite transporter (DMT)-like permease|uniref:DMT family transporter n=1 Tax=Mesorhizobium koreense TaxID=3074855 RepID=UPI00287B8417|nr:DMT family transporter [Mesorhizobium sp. WR6]